MVPEKGARSREEHHWFILAMNQQMPHVFRQTGGFRRSRRNTARLSGRQNQTPILTAVEKTGVNAGLMTAPTPECGLVSARGQKREEARLKHVELCRQERRNRWGTELAHAGVLDPKERDAIIKRREIEGGYTCAGVGL